MYSSQQWREERARYKVFAEEVARLTGCKNAYNAITIEGGRLAIHEVKGRKVVREAEVINFDKDFFKGKQCLVFDDVLTKGHSYARFACALERWERKFWAVIFWVKQF